MENYNKLVETHTGLVTCWAKRLMKMNENCDWLTEDDLLGAGYEALWAAARTYDARRTLAGPLLLRLRRRPHDAPKHR